MNKKILVAAIGAALSVGMAAAQAAEVKISGYANVSIDQVEGNTGTGTDNESQLGVSSNSSNIVISATEDLGNGLKGVFSLQEFYRLDNTGNTTAATGSRNSGGNAYVGLQGNFGLIKAGSHDTPAKLVGRSVDLFGNQLGDSRNLGVNNNRAQNVIAYVSPNFGGFSFAVAHSTNLTDGSATETTTSANAVLLKYEGGPVSVGVGVDMTSTDGLGAGADDQEWKNVGVSVGPFGGVKINGFYQIHDNVNNVAATDRTTMGAGVAWKFGDNTVKAQYYTVEVDGATSADGSMWAVGFDHAFSKAFTGYVAYAATDNEANAAWTVASGGHNDTMGGTVTGKDPSGFQVGMVFKF